VAPPSLPPPMDGGALLVVTASASAVLICTTGAAMFVAWLIVGMATYQESPDDTPIIVALFSK
jgi:hypothetical protein